ncbi:MAG TPA: EAL domain-containing protein [Solirubrobacteraceae bacterium]|jgi:diguanylate cyclase (GGDEF)-like protein|nr:EAL domain-containing protein [Solirubrobacteraceae bacterium]
MVPIEGDDHVRRARRTAAWARATIGAVGIILIAAWPSLLPYPVCGIAGFATILLTALVQLYWSRLKWLRGEESLAAAAAILIVGLGNQHVDVLSILWLAAVASGVMARGGRVHWIGRAVVLLALVLPVIREGRLSNEHAGLIVATIALLLTIGRLTVELNSLLRRARWDADHDGLTGLLSRTAFRARLEQASAKASEREPLALLLFDLDGFGAINKTAGHAAGDQLLCDFAEVLRAQEGPSTVIGRLGGDEFAVLLRDADGLELAGRLREALPRGDEEARRISASGGLAHAPRDGNDAEALLRAADIALRVAKKAPGGGHVSEYAGESLGGGQRNARASLQRIIDGDGLTMVVQPIVDLRSGLIHAYEALARFGAKGSDSPLQWFALADELGEREALERACLREALELFCRRPRNVHLSVNLSSPVLMDRETLQMLERMPDLSGLIVEITEEALVHNEAQLNAVLAPLRERGVQMAVDDMGAGYSGLNQIMAVHPRYLKLDRSLITGIDSDRERSALVAALANYAERVGSLLVAEGMETEAELLTLIELGVPLAQGFYLGRPSQPWPGLRTSVPGSSSARAARGQSDAGVAHGVERSPSAAHRARRAAYVSR